METFINAWIFQLVTPDWIMVQMYKFVKSIRVIVSIVIGITVLNRIVFRNVNFQDAIKADVKNLGKIVTAIVVAIILAIGLANTGKANQYRSEIEKSCDLYFFEIVPSCASWGLAQMEQESGYREKVVSWAGARGILQIMSGTEKWIETELKKELNSFDVSDSVEMWGFLMWKNYKHFSRYYLRKNFPDRGTATLASYNAGAGWVLKSYRRSEEKKFIGFASVIFEEMHPKHKSERYWYWRRIFSKLKRIEKERIKEAW